MAGPFLAGVLRYLGALAGAGGSNRGDEELLERFVARRDEDAFATLLDRHGPLVLGVCRQVLGDTDDVEDAFQATFLILARKAASVRRQEALAAWLHRVALNLARTARDNTIRRRVREREAVLMAPTNPTEDDAPYDWQPILHEEVDRLPEKYRLPVVLCYFDGNTHEETARRLGWPVGTVKGRLARARDLLRARLDRRGVTLTAAGLTAVLTDGGVAVVPPPLLALTLRAAVSFAAGGTAPGAAAAALALANGATRTMTTTKLLTVTFLIVAIGGVGVAVLGPGRARNAHASTDERLPEKKDVPPERPGAAAFGPEVKGLRARITLPRVKFEVGEAINVTYVVKNVSLQEQILWHSGFWPNHQIVVRDAKGKEPPLTALGQQRRQAFSPGGPRGKNVPWKVPPGGTDAAYEKYDLTGHYDLSAPGRYDVQYVYEEKQGGWEGRLPSNVVAFEVVAVKERKGDGRAESRPVRVDGLEWVALAPGRAAKPPVGGTRDFDLGLRVTNVSDKPVALRTFDVIRPRLTWVNGLRGVAIGLDGGRDGTPKPSPPAMLAPGKSWTWQPQARLDWTIDRAALRLSGPDGRGVAGYWSFGTLKEGKYRLAIEYANSSPKQGDVALWIGKVTTEEVAFEIVAAEAPPVPPQGQASDPKSRPIEELIAELNAGDGATRVAATKEIFRRGKETLPDLQRAGARQLAPAATADRHRLHVLYSLLEGLPPELTAARTGYRPDRFRIYLERECKKEEVAEWGERLGFSIPFICYSGHPIVMLCWTKERPSTKCCKLS